MIPIYGQGPSLVGWLEKETGFVFDKYMQPRAFVRGEYVFAFPGRGFVAVVHGGIFRNRSMKIVGFLPGAILPEVAPKPLSAPPVPSVPPTPRPPQKPLTPPAPAVPAGLQNLAPFEVLEDVY